MDLFDDLPEPTQTKGPVSAASPKSTKEEEHKGEEEKRLKRKLGDADCHNDNNERNEAEEQGNIKKLCKEGFLLFHPNASLC